MNKENNKYTLLVVDDDEGLREVTASIFEAVGFNVITAESGSAALKLVVAQKVDIIISDIKMPNGDGISMLEEIRKIYPDIPVVFLMTGFSEHSEAECLSKGAKKVFQKPFNKKEIVSAVLDSLPLL